MAGRRSLVRAASTGNRPEALEVLRGLLAQQIQDCESSRDVAALGRLLCEVLAQIETLSAATTTTREDDTVDEIARRRSRGVQTPAESSFFKMWRSIWNT
jgi:hypothetical protein